MLKSKGNGEQRGAPSLETMIHSCWVTLARGITSLAAHPHHPCLVQEDEFQGGVQSRKWEGRGQACSPTTSVFTRLYTCVKNF